MLATFSKPAGNFFEKVVNVPVRFTILINEIFNPKKVNLFQDKTNFTVLRNESSKKKGDLMERFTFPQVFRLHR
jgi:hypothetical protein